MFKKCSHRENRSTTLSLRFAVWRSPNPSVAACISSNKFDSPAFELHPVFLSCLKIFQGYFTVQLSRLFVVLVSATTPIYYQSHLLLSRTFLFIFLFFAIIRFLLNIMGLSGLEPPTSRLSGVRSNRLSYKPFFNPATTCFPISSPI